MKVKKIVTFTPDEVLRALQQAYGVHRAKSVALFPAQSAALDRGASRCEVSWEEEEVVDGIHEDKAK